jgi:hypothetical protein
LSSKISTTNWKNYFGEVFNCNTLDVREEWKITPDTAHNDPILDSEVTSNEVGAAIKSLKVGKAPGFDGVLPQFIKLPSGYLQGILAYLCTTILKTACYPAAWVMSVVVPLYKGKGSREDVNSYRGIFPTCTGWEDGLMRRE